ncbi:hypothetical protein Chor_005493 [Crotalus horridus]
MGNSMNKILPGLFLGNIVDAKDLDQLSKNDITHIISIHESPQPFIPLEIIQDNPEVRHTHKGSQIKKNSRTPEVDLSLAGISRSTTIILAYLMAVTPLGWLEALEAVKAVRPVANPNLGFRQQLEEFGRSRSIQKIRRKLQQCHRGTPFNDHEAVRGLLSSGRKQELPSPKQTWADLGPGATGPGVKQMDSLLIRVKETFFCLPSCLK